MNLYIGNATTIAKSGSALAPKLQITKDAQLNCPSDWLQANIEIPVLTVHFTRLSPGSVAEGTGSIRVESRVDEPADVTLTIRRDPTNVVASNTQLLDGCQKKLLTVDGSEILSEGAPLAVYRLFASTTTSNSIRLIGPLHFTMTIRF